ncbi:J domain-containing protein [Jiangella alba]|uniref:DnaJ domain-containing protein n=1 Tax=Jiangella alba TaxID=561176 RepID=A0A1H5PLY3_9ACTN|nr:J domain-containing protein [Jiangella alba]SEF14912.1 DnaJ domain-containing protein [Jiangella alba]
MPDLDYYELLEVPPTATAAEIKDAYRRAVRTAHPDVGGTTAMFRQITTAYETLSDPVRRADYDAGLVHPGARTTDVWPDDLDAEAPQPADPGWGHEASWDAADGRPDTYVGDPDAWIHGRRGLLVIELSWTVVAAIFAFGVVILLYTPEWLRPGAAGPDLLSWYGEQPVVRLVSVVAYLAILGSVWADSARALVAVHAAFALLLVGWVVAYWGIATTPERWWFGAGVVLWLLYNVLLTATVYLSGAREEFAAHRRRSDPSQVSDLTRWARTDAGGRAVQIGYGVLAVTFVFLAVVLLVANGLIRPAAAGPDALDVGLRYPLAVAIVVVLYGYIAYISIGHRSGLELVFVPVAIGLLAWPLAYWDLATTSERWLFGLVVVAWALHVAAMYATSSLIDRRRPTPEWTR